MHMFNLQRVILSGNKVAVSGNEHPHFFPEPGGSNSGCLFEYTCKIGFLIVTETEAYLSNGFIGINKEILRFHHPSHFNNFGNTPVQDTLTKQVKIPG